MPKRLTRLFALTMLGASTTATARPMMDRMSVVRGLRHELAVIPEPGETIDGRSGQEIARSLRAARVVGLGEASHGSHQLFLVKAAMVKLLVERLGFHVLAMELDPQAGLKINDFIQSRSTEATFDLKPWDTEEFWALLRWLRNHNRHVPPAQRVSVIGIAALDRRLGADELLSYVRRVAPRQAEAAQGVLTDRTFPPSKLPTEEAFKLQRGYEELYLFLELHGADLIARSSAGEYRSMLALAHTLVQPGFIFGSDDPFEADDPSNEFMAENLRDAIDAAPAREKFILWAHNGHVELDTAHYHPAGYYLHRLYGRGYYALGTTFYEGEIQSWTGKSPNFGLKVWNVRPVTSDSVEALFKEAGPPNFFLDFHSLQGSSALAHWLGAPHPLRSVGAMYAPNYEDESGAPSASYDGLIFVSKSSRAIPTARMREKYPDRP